MDYEAIEQYCSELPGAQLTFPFGEDTCVWKVAGKMFALYPRGSEEADEPARVNVKCDPDLAIQLRASYDAIIPGYHMNKRHWNTVICDGSIEDDMVLQLIEDSYDLVVDALPYPAWRSLREQPKES